MFKNTYIPNDFKLYIRLKKKKKTIICYHVLGEVQEDISKLKPNAKRYDCPNCSEVFYLTPTEILKHKKSHL